MDNLQKFLRQNTEDIWRRTFRTQKSDSDCENWSDTVDWIHDSWRYIENAQCKLQNVQFRRKDGTRQKTQDWQKIEIINLTLLFSICVVVSFTIYSDETKKNWAMLYNIAWLFTLKVRELFFAYVMESACTAMEILVFFQGWTIIVTFLLTKIRQSLPSGNYQWLLLKDTFHVQF